MNNQVNRGDWYQQKFKRGAHRRFSHKEIRAVVIKHQKMKLDAIKMAQQAIRKPYAV